MIAAIIIAVILGSSYYYMLRVATIAGKSTTTSTVSPPVMKPPVERKVIAEVKDSTISYREAIVYEKGVFRTIVDSWRETSSNISNDVVNRYGRNIRIVDVKCHYMEVNDTVTVEFTVLDKVWTTSGGGRYADFLWLLTPLNLDFINNHFEETNKGLFWEGMIDGVRTSVEVLLPPQPVPYRAWQQPIGHCHGHVWWGKTSTSRG